MTEKQNAEQKLRLLVDTVKGWLIQEKDIQASMALAIFLAENFQAWIDGLVAHVADIPEAEYKAKKADFYKSKQQTTEQQP